MSPLPWVDVGPAIAGVPWVPMGDLAHTSILGHWPLDGNANDYSGNGRNGSIAGTLSWPGGGAIPGSVSTPYFGGAGWIRLPTGIPLPQTAWSISVWHYTATPAQTGWLIGSSDTISMSYGNMGGALPGTGNGIVAFGYVASAAWRICVDPTVCPANTWMHHCGTWNGTTLRLFRNGVDVRSETPVVGCPALGSQQIQIGNRLDNSGQYFKGYEDDVRLYGVTLTPAQVDALYKRSLGEIRPWVPLGKV